MTTIAAVSRTSPATSTRTTPSSPICQSGPAPAGRLPRPAGGRDRRLPLVAGQPRRHPPGLGGVAAPGHHPRRPELARIGAIAGDMLVAIGFCELADGPTANRPGSNAAAVLDGSGVYGNYRKVHQPLGENMSYASGDGYGVFDTPVGRVGLQICYDKAVPRGGTCHGARRGPDHRQPVGVAAARTATAEDLQQDRWTYRFNLFDSSARALDNPGVLGRLEPVRQTFGSLRYVGNAKVVDPGGNVLATTLLDSGMAVAGRRHRGHVRPRCGAGCSTCGTVVPDVYGALTQGDLAHA